MKSHLTPENNHFRPKSQISLFRCKQTIAWDFPLAPLVAEKTAWLVSIKFLNSYLPVKASGGWLRKIECHLSASTSPIINHRMRKQTIALGFPLAPLVAEKTAWLVSIKFFEFLSSCESKRWLAAQNQVSSVSINQPNHQS